IADRGELPMPSRVAISFFLELFQNALNGLTALEVSEPRHHWLGIPESFQYWSEQGPLLEEVIGKRQTLFPEGVSLAGHRRRVRGRRVVRRPGSEHDHQHWRDSTVTFIVSLARPDLALLAGDMRSRGSERESRWTNA